jgi:hypothetical protein
MLSFECNHKHSRSYKNESVISLTAVVISYSRRLLDKVGDVERSGQ